MKTNSSAKRYTGAAPFGFSWDGEILVPHEKEAEIRRLAFELFLEHRRKGTVATALNDAGHRTRRGSRWRDVTVGRMLTCPSAIGEYAVNKTRKNTSGERVELPPEEWEVIECEPIIELRIWEAVRELLADDAAPTKKASRPANDALTPLVQCHCGTSMVLENAGSKFVCRDCRHQIPASDLEAIVLDEVRDYLSSRQEILQAFIERPQAVLEAEERLCEHQHRLREAEEKMSKIHQLYMGNKIDIERFGKLHHPLEEERGALRKSIPALEREVVVAKQKHAGDATVSVDVNGVVDLWPELPMRTKRVILTELFERVVVGHGEIEIEGRFPQTPLRTPTNQQTDEPTTAPLPTSIDEPIYIRLPKPGTRCEKTGLTRSMLNELILATERNGRQPPVKSFALRRQGNVRGSRYILWESLKSYLAEQQKQD